MLPIERLEKITEYIEKKDFATIAELIELLKVSKPTVMRDLATLEKKGSIIRTYGGAASIHKGTNFEPSYKEKENQAIENKVNIAKLARKFIFSGETILLDSGSTTFMLAKELVQAKNITVITNDIKNAMILSENEDIDLVVLGGQKRKGVYSLIGPLTEIHLKDLNVDKVFLGADAVDIKRGITNSNIDEVSIKKCMIEIASEVILLADSSKFNKAAFTRISKIEALNKVISDSWLSDLNRKMLMDVGVEVHLSPS